MLWEKIVEKIKLFFYPLQQPLNIFSTWINLFLFAVVFSSLVYYHGYPQTPEIRKLLFSLVTISFTYYIFSYFLEFISAHRLKDFIREKWFEGILVLLLIIEGISYQFWGSSLPVRLLTQEESQDLFDFTLLITQVYFLIIVLAKLFSDKNQQSPFFRIHPALLFLLAFLCIIVLGTFLLMLPEMSIQEGGLSLLQALFMSISAACVTGLTTFDVPSLLTGKGHIVLIFLMKIGGINIVSFGGFIALVARLGVGVKQHPVIEDLMMRDNLISSRGILSKVLLWGTGIEALGAVGLFLYQNEMLYSSTQERVFNAIFHAVSAFNNAGLSIFPGGFTHEGVRFNYHFLAITGLLILLGSLSFIALFDIFSLQRIRERIEKPWKGFEFHTRIALYFSIVLLFFGAFIFFILEYSHSLRHYPFAGKIITALFHSITTRTAGFSALELREVSLSVLFIFLLLMLIGASSGSTGGGVKTSSFALLYASFISSLRGLPNAVLFKRTLHKDLIYRAFSTFFFFIACIFCFTFCLSITESALLASKKYSFFDLLFEEFSAFNTVGLSCGLTTEASVGGQIILMLSMFLGRTGTILIAFMLANNASIRSYAYPSAHLLVG